MYLAPIVGLNRPTQNGITKLKSKLFLLVRSEFLRNQEQDDSQIPKPFSKKKQIRDSQQPIKKAPTYLNWHGKEVSLQEK